MWIRQLGSCYFRLGETKEAEATWQRLLDVYPQRSGALRYLGSIYTQHKLYDKAIATYREAITLSPENPDLRVSLAQTQNAAGDPLSALATLSSVRGASSSYRERRINAVRDEAVTALDLTPAVQQALRKKLAEGTTSTGDLASFLATLCEERGQARDAARFYRRVAEAEPKSERGRRAATRAAALDPGKKD
jgi:tetratricopeptide (TPR) repeat protein